MITASKIRLIAGFVVPALAVIAVADVNADNQSLRFSSGNRQVALIELFTSEGCSSCPPADRWLSGLKNDRDLWSGVVPLAFHVDYWDYIGWRDRFARSEFSERQRRYAREGGVNTVYTPGMFKDGREWRGWFWSKEVDSSDADVGDLTFTVTDNFVNAIFNPDDDNYSNLILNVAVLGLNLQTQVAAGENRGKNLRHDFVVLAHATAPFSESKAQFHGQLPLPEPKVSASEKAVVAWVSARNNQAPIQATGGLIID